MKNQDTHPNRFYFDVAQGHCFFYRNEVLKDTFIEKVSPSSIQRILQLIKNPTFLYEPFSTVIYFRRKYANGY
jgi:hypothetical protein